MDAIRQHTRHLHDRIERAIDFPTRLATLSGYADLLARLHGYYEPIEARLAGTDFTPVGLDFAPRRKAHLLRADLAALDRPTGPLCTELPIIDDLGSALGCLYVLEGATLGGQFLRREVQGRFGLTADRGCAFYACYGDRVGPMWNAFCKALTAGTADPDDEARATAAAVTTFETLERWITGAGA